MSLHIWSAAALVVLVAAPAAAQDATRSAADIITAVGCVQPEKDYRTQVADGKGGVGGSGVGAANEYVLRSARTVSSVTLKPIATGDLGEVIYSLTGNMESDAARAVGQQIAVSGYVEIAASEGTNKVKDLPRLNILGWHVVAKACQTSAAPK